MQEITFLVHEAEEGGYYAQAAGFGIFAEGEAIDELKENIKGGIDCRFNAGKNAHIKFENESKITYHR